MENNKENIDKVTITSYNPVEDPDDVIAADKDNNRKEAFRETYKRIMNIIPEYFMTLRKRRKNGGTGGFSQNIVVTPEKVTVETKEVDAQEKQNEKEEKQIGD